MKFGERLAMYRISQNLNQREFAKLGSVSYVSQSHYESGKRVPDVQYMKNLYANGYDITDLIKDDIDYNISGVALEDSVAILKKMQNNLKRNNRWVEKERNH